MLLNISFLDDLPNITAVLYLHVKESFGSSKLMSQAIYNLSNLTLNDQHNYITLYFEEIKVIKNKF